MFNQFVGRVKELYSPEVFILFGSRAKGTSLRESDYDFLIVSRAFEGVPFTDRMTEIFKIWDLEEDLECLCLTPEEFNRAREMISIIQEAMKDGVAL